MTASAVVSRALDAGEGQLSTPLPAVHRAWLEETRKILGPASRLVAGILLRWSAIQYLSTTSSHRFELERAAVESLGQMIEPGHAAQLGGS